MIRKPNFIIIALICVIVVVEILFLRPSNVETGEETTTTTNMYNSIETMVKSEKYKDEVGYTIDGFHYTAVEGELRHWELKARQAILYEKSKFVVAHATRIKMYDPQGRITEITGDEAQYRMESRDLSLSGNVTVLFPDGFRLETQRAQYDAKEGMISSSEPFHGETVAKEGKKPQQEFLEVWGRGFRANRSGPEILVNSNVHVQSRRLESDDLTDVHADQAKIDRFRKIATFSMANSNRLVQAHQGTLKVTSRRQEVAYNADTNMLKQMTATDDVTILETDSDTSRRGMKYATSQKAEFLTQDDKILLSGFPSVYQQHDTVTGELITIYRNKNLVEVTHANAFHDGTSSAP